MKLGNSFKLGKTCLTCHVRLLDKNKSGYCTHHRDRTGTNNPFFGKKHSTDTILQMKEKTSIASKKLWKNPEYRNKVIKAVSKPRRIGFKKEQSKRVSEWYRNNPNQIILRSVSMSKSWSDGKIGTPKHTSCNRSKIEDKFFLAMQEFCGVQTNQIIYSSAGRRFYPDGVLEKDKIIIEFFGNYWHANPAIYKSDQVVYHGKTAEQIWSQDRERKTEIEKIGYWVISVWEKEYKENPKAVLSNLDNLLNWEGCSL